MATPRFKVGDKVRIRENLNDIREFLGGYSGYMSTYEGIIVTITTVVFGTHDRIGYRTKETNYIWDERSLEPISVFPNESQDECCMYGIKKVIYNNPATIILWEDGTKTVVKVQDGDVYSKELGFAMCVSKKFFGNQSNFNNVFKKYVYNTEQE